jgi:hypothetical protein
MLMYEKDLAKYLPKTEEEADERLLNVLKIAVEEKGWSLCVVKRMMLTQLRNLNNFEEKTWPLFLTMLSLNE